MANKNSTMSRADNAQSASAMRDAHIRDEIAKERTAFDTRTAKLKALRLAREAEEAAEKAAADALKPVKAPRKSRAKPDPNPVQS